MDGTTRISDANLYQRLKSVEDYRKWHRFDQKDLSSQQRAFEKTKIIVEEIYKEAENIADKEFCRNLILATIKLLSDAGYKRGDELNNIIKNLLKSMIEGKI